MIRHWAFFHTTVFILIAAHASINASPLTPTKQGVTGIFFWGGKVVFPDFFPILVDPKQISVVLKTEKQKKKKKKKRSSPHFLTFPPSIFNFPSFLLHFPFFLASLFLVRQQKFPGQKFWGALCPPSVMPLPPRGSAPGRGVLPPNPRVPFAPPNNLPWCWPWKGLWIAQNIQQLYFYNNFMLWYFLTLSNQGVVATL